MLQIKRNTSEFKEIKSIVNDYADQNGRKRWILLYALKPSATLSSRILLNTRKKDSDALYELAYDSLVEYFHDPAKKLFKDQKTGLYYFKSNALSKWIELPFEFKGKLKKQIQPLSIVR